MNRIVPVILLLVFVSCGESKPEQSKLDKIDWILGYWEYSSESGTVTESWIKTDDTTYSGVGKFMDSLGNPVSTEEIKIELRDGKLWYLPLVSGQNDGQVVPFEEGKFNDTIVFFENPEHDFPQRIVYQKLSDTSILAYLEIIGSNDGDVERIEFPYVRKN